MKALLLAVGFQGDVRPMVARADRLRRQGHGAVLVAPALFRPLAIACRVPFAPLDLDMMRVADAISHSCGARFLPRLAMTMGGRAAEVLAGAWGVAANCGADVVVHHPVLPLGQHLAERLGVPAVVALPFPA